jgi:hypothetical protein
MLYNESRNNVSLQQAEENTLLSQHGIKSLLECRHVFLALLYRYISNTAVSHCTASVSYSHRHRAQPEHGECTAFSTRASSAFISRVQTAFTPHHTAPHRHSHF